MWSLRLFKAILNLQTVDQNSIDACGSDTASSVTPTSLIVPLVENSAGLLNFGCTIVFLTFSLCSTFVLLFDCCLHLP